MHHRHTAELSDRLRKKTLTPEISIEAQKSLRDNLLIEYLKAEQIVEPLTTEQLRLVFKGAQIIKARLLYVIHLLEDDTENIEKLSNSLYALSDDGASLATILNLDHKLAGQLATEFAGLPIILPFKELFEGRLLSHIRDSLKLLITTLFALKQNLGLEARFAFDVCKNLNVYAFKSAAEFSRIVKDETMALLANNITVHEKYNKIFPIIKNKLRHMDDIWNEKVDFIFNYMNIVERAYAAVEDNFIFATSAENVNFIKTLNAAQIKQVPEMVQFLLMEMLYLMDVYDKNRNYILKRITPLKDTLRELFRSQSMTLPDIYSPSDRNYSPYRAELYISAIYKFFHDKPISIATLKYINDLISAHFINTSLQMSTLVYYSHQGNNPDRRLLPIFEKSNYRVSYPINANSVGAADENFVLFARSRQDMRQGLSLESINQTFQADYLQEIIDRENYILGMTIGIGAVFGIATLLINRNPLMRAVTKYFFVGVNGSLIKSLSALPASGEKIKFLSKNEIKKFKKYITTCHTLKEKKENQIILARYKEYFSEICMFTLNNISEHTDPICITIINKQTKQSLLKIYDYPSLLSHVVTCNKKNKFVDNFITLHTLKDDENAVIENNTIDNENISVIKKRGYPDFLIELVDDVREKIAGMTQLRSPQNRFFSTSAQKEKPAAIIEVDNITDEDMAATYIRNTSSSRFSMRRNN